MHFFGALGTLMFMIGLVLTLYMGIDKLFIHPDATRIASRAEFYIALVTMVLGTQLFLTGFLAELMVRNSPDTNNYQISERKGELPEA
jgi:hypothetical protein